MKFKNKNILVYGLGESGQGAISLLIKKNAKVFVFDDNMDALKNYHNKDVIKLECLTQNILKIFKFIVVNPSISKYCENLKLAKLLNIKLISEIELANIFNRGQTLAITGTNGKSTTCSLIYNILKNANKDCNLVGNIGKSFAKCVSENNKQIFVTEVSSFQLETTNKFPTKISCFLNFSENHLDRHFSIDEYFKTKLKILDNAKYKIVNYDDSNFNGLKPLKNLFYFSKSSEVKGCFVKNQIIYFKNKKIEKVLDVSNISLLGQHNLENVLCAVLVAKLMKIKNENIVKAIKTFKGLNHRIEYVDEINNVQYYNDSKSTTVFSTLKALSCFTNQDVLLILGGSDKGFEFDNLFVNIPSCVKEIVAIGEVSDKILQTAKKYDFLNISKIDDFRSAIKESKKICENKKLNVVLLSPATASFDLFKNFEERGNTFKKIVGELKSET